MGKWLLTHSLPNGEMAPNTGTFKLLIVVTYIVANTTEKCTVRTAVFHFNNRWRHSGLSARTIFDTVVNISTYIYAYTT